VDASYGTFNDVGNNQYNTNITHVESNRDDLEILARIERLIYRAVVLGVVAFILLLGTMLALVYMYALSFPLKFWSANPFCRCLHY